MTTSWAWLVRGRLIESARANVGGMLLGLLAVVGVVWMYASALVGRWVAWKPNEVALAVVALAVLFVALVQWGWRLLASY